MYTTRPRRPPERQLRQQLIQFARMTWERGLLVGLDGNLSVRLTDQLLLATRAGCHKGLLTDDDLVVVDLAGHKLRGMGRPTSEMAMHLACYAARPDIDAVIHAHPPTCIAFTLAGLSLAEDVLPEVVLTLGRVPTLSYATTGTLALAGAVGEAATDHDAMILDRHGAVCLGADLRAAYCNLETIEHLAKITRDARALVLPAGTQIRTLPPTEVATLRAIGRQSAK